MRSRRLRSLACALTLAASACGGRVAIPTGPEPRPIVQLEADDVHSLALLLRMEDTRLLDTVLVGRLLGDDSEEVRARAALAAGRVRDPGATPLLLRAAADSSAWVRRQAAFALGQSGDSSTAVTDVLARIALNDATGPAIEAASAISRLSVQAARLVIDSLLVGRYHVSLRNEAATVAWRLPRDSGTIGRLAVLASDEDPDTRWRALYALARTGSPDAVPTFLDRAGDPDHQVRANAVRGLRAAHADSADVREQALATLLTAAADSHPHVRINALRLLPAYSAPDRTSPVLISLLQDNDGNVAIAATQALAEAADPAATTPLRDVARSGNRPAGVRTAALAALSRIDATAAAAVAMTWVAAPEWVLRQHAARILAASPWSIAAEPLQRLARDPHPRVAADALGAVRTLADSLPESRRVFIEGAGAAHPLVRAAALRGLAGVATAADLDLMLQAYATSQGDRDRAAALAALTGLQQIAEVGTPVGPAFYLRFAGKGPPRDPALYRAIVERIGTPPAAWLQPDTVTPPRPIGFYEDAVRTLIAPVLAGGAPPRVAIGTPHGEIVLELAGADAPLTVHNMVSLIEDGYYEGTRWHRVVPNFVIQDGERGDATGGPGYAIRDEINTIRYLRGTLGMALSGPDTGSSQFFITHSPTPHLDGGYTVFGSVVSGMDAVDSVVQEEDILYIRVLR